MFNYHLPLLMKSLPESPRVPWWIPRILSQDEEEDNIDDRLRLIAPRRIRLGFPLNPPDSWYL